MIELKFNFDEKDLKIFKSNSFKFANELDKVIKRTAFEVRNTAVKGISQGSRHGRLYRRKSVVHQASAPGEYPKTDTGRLVGSIRVNTSYLTAEIGSDVNYSQYLETGSAYMQPRPWLEPSYEKVKDKMLDWIDDALERTFGL